MLCIWCIIWLLFESWMGSWDDVGFFEKWKGVYCVVFYWRVRSDGWVWFGVVGGDCGVLS